MSRFETAHSCNLEALYTALPAFLAPAAQDDASEDENLEGEPGFEPLVLPLQLGCTPWQVKSDGRLASVLSPATQD